MHVLHAHAAVIFPFFLKMIELPVNENERKIMRSCMHTHVCLYEH